MHSGSRRHILDWVARPAFAAELTALLAPSGAVVCGSDAWMPKGHGLDAEARLEQDGDSLLPGATDWSRLREWWLKHNGRANTPNWDLASSCTIGSTRGLVLVEAKAHVEELSDEGKRLDKDASARSGENHERIGQAIAEASAALSAMAPGVRLSRESHYQLANRVAFSWKLATMGVENVLVYLGFTGDSRHGTPLQSADHWASVFRSHAARVLPAELLERRVPCGPAGFHVLIRAMPVPA